MNFLNLTFFLVLSITSVTLLADNSPTEVPINFKKLYVPSGFDDNDAHVQIVGEGSTTGICHSYANTTFEIDHINKKISLYSTSFKYGGYCLSVNMPFEKVMDFGILQEGIYTIVQEPGSKQFGQITIKKSNREEADDYLYAVVKKAQLKSDGGVNYVYLTLNLPLSCMKLQEVRPTPNVQSSTLVIQPIVEIDKSISCKETNQIVEVKVSAKDFKRGHFLTHVRSMSGHAVNEIFDLNPYPRQPVK